MSKDLKNQEEGPGPVTTKDRRQHLRITGPFDGRRVSALKTPVQIYDLSQGGCFINSVHEQQLGVTCLLEIDLPYEGSITVKAETLYSKPEFGFAVRFIEMTEDTSARLLRVLQRLKELAPRDQ